MLFILTLTVKTANNFSYFFFPFYELYSEKAVSVGAQELFINFALLPDPDLLSSVRKKVTNYSNSTICVELAVPVPLFIDIQ